MLSRVTCVHRGKIGRDADVGHNHAEVFLRNYGADVGLHPRNVLIGQLDPGARGSLHIDDELPGIGAWKERQPQKWIHPQAEKKYSDNTYDNSHGSQQTAPDQNVIPHQTAVIFAIEPTHKSLECTTAGMMPRPMVCSSQKLRAKQWHDSHRYSVRCKQRKHDR